MLRTIKGLIVILVLIFLGSCVDWVKFEEDFPNPENMEEMEVDDNFNWQTASTVNFHLKNAPAGVIKFTSVNDETTYHKGNYTGNTEYYSIKLMLPDYINEIKINNIVLPLESSTVTYDFGLKSTAMPIDYSLSFDGTDDYVEIDDDGLIADYPFTLAAWVKTIGFSDPNEDMVIVNLADPSKDNRYYGIFIGADEGGVACIRARKGSAKTDEGTTNLTDDNWHYVVGVFNGKKDRKLYVDGLLEASGTQNCNFDDAAEKTVFGRWGDETPKSYFNGNIDEICIWEKALSSQEINDYMNTAPSGNEDDLVGYWKFDNGSGSTVTDETDNEYDGTIYGAVWISDTGGGNDSDGDGIDNDNDDYPGDPSRAFNNYYPAGQYGSIAFEDLWPGTGDYDFNDLVVDYQFKTVTNASNYVVEIVGNFVVRAIGATLQNGFGFQFPDVSVSSADLTVTGYDISEGYIQLNTNGTEASQTLNTIIVFDNAFNILPNISGESGVNTEENGTYVQPDTVTITMTFTADTYDENTINISAFNPFLIINMEREKEIHLADYVPTSLADTAIFGTFHDDSNPLQGRYYKTDDNLPWAINIYESFDYPMEKSEIIQAYLKFAQWASSGGNQFNDWYQDDSGYRNDNYIY